MFPIKIVKYGLFNSEKEFPNLTMSPKRKVPSFEFDFILSCDENAVSFINDKSCKLSPNMLILRKPEEISNSLLHFKCYCIHLNIDKNNSIYGDLLSSPSYYTFINVKTYQTLFEQLFIHLVKHTDSADNYYIYAKILELLYNIKKDSKYNRVHKRRFLKKENFSVQKAVSYMKKNLSNDITLEKLGDITGYSPNHFQRVFIGVIGVSPQKYLENLKIENAKFLLAQNEKTLSEIADECGFSSESYLCKVFKKHTLLTPKEFRRLFIFKYENID